MKTDTLTQIPKRVFEQLGRPLSAGQRTILDDSLHFNRLWSDIGVDTARLTQISHDTRLAVDLIERGDADALSELLDVADPCVSSDLERIVRAGVRS